MAELTANQSELFRLIANYVEDVATSMVFTAYQRFGHGVLSSHQGLMRLISIIVENYLNDCAYMLSNDKFTAEYAHVREYFTQMCAVDKSSNIHSMDILMYAANLIIDGVYNSDFAHIDLGDFMSMTTSIRAVIRATIYKHRGEIINLKCACDKMHPQIARGDKVFTVEMKNDF